MLDTSFRRVVGDVGNPESFAFPVRYARVPGATAHKVVVEGANGLLEQFIARGRDLQAEGCAGITTTCGFLAPFQQELAAALDVPVAASALIQAPLILAMLPPHQALGVLTVRAQSLTNRHFPGVPAGPRLVWEGTPEGGHFQSVFLGKGVELDLELAEAEVVEAARALVAARPDVGALLLECANMPPYAQAVQSAVGRPVHCALSMCRWFYDGLTRMPTLLGK